VAQSSKREASSLTLSQRLQIGKEIVHLWIRQFLYKGTMSGQWIVNLNSDLIDRPRLEPTIPVSDRDVESIGSNGSPFKLPA
jgi:hypothetical protein